MESFTNPYMNELFTQILSKNGNKFVRLDAVMNSTATYEVTQSYILVIR